jgi:hypothetical protein
MGLRQNKHNWICLLSCFWILSLQGQDSASAEAMVAEDTIVYETEASQQQFDPFYHFDDSAQSDYNRSVPQPEFDRAYWKTLSRDMTFEEKDKKEKKDSTAKPKREKKSNVGFNPGSLKYAWVVLVLLILGFVIYKLLPAWDRNNLKNKEKLLISLDELDEEQIRAMDILTPLEQALKNGDYRTAYRLRYLSVLKELISRNIILYKKEKTNYEYLLQLTGLAIYEPFRLLTFNFDGIWYGDLIIDKARYEALEQHFSDFNNKLNT